MSTYDEDEQRRRSNTTSRILDFAGDVLEAIASCLTSGVVSGTVEIAGSCIEGIGCVIVEILSSL